MTVHTTRWPTPWTVNTDTYHGVFATVGDAEDGTVYLFGEEGELYVGNDQDMLPDLHAVVAMVNHYPAVVATLQAWIAYDYAYPLHLIQNQETTGLVEQTYRVLDRQSPTLPERWALAAQHVQDAMREMQSNQ